MPLERSTYSFTAKILHWLIAVLLIVNGILALTDEWWPEADLRTVIDLHKSIGITVLLLVILRILWRLTHRPPPLPDTMPAWEVRLAYWGHLTLYTLILLVPFSGWCHDSAWDGAATHPMTLFGLVPWPRIGFIMDMSATHKEYLHNLFGEAHTILNYLLYAVLAVHVLAVYKHERLDKIRLLHRMNLWNSK
jgi:cytochrome b561